MIHLRFVQKTRGSLDARHVHLEIKKEGVLLVLREQDSIDLLVPLAFFFLDYSCFNGCLTSPFRFRKSHRCGILMSLFPVMFDVWFKRFSILAGNGLDGVLARSAR